MEIYSLLQSHLARLALDLLRLCIWLAILLLIFAPLETRWALRPKQVIRKAFGTDLVYYFLSGFAPKLLMILPLTLIATTVHYYVGGGYYSWVAGLPIAVRVSGAIVVGEVGSYWGHRWSHEIPFLWRFHSIHHSAEEIDWLVNSRAHPVDILFTRLCGLVPMFLLGLAQPMSNRVDLVPALVTVLGTIWGFFIHANIKWRFGWLEWLVSSPAFHHWHHTNDGPESINKNYAAMLPCVDKCFGTFYLPEQRWPERYGVDPPGPGSFSQQLLRPLGLLD